LFAALTGAYLLKTDRLSFLSALRLVKWPFLVFLLLFVGLIFTNKDTSNIGLGAGGVALLLVVNYIVGPLAAFNYFLTHQQEYFQSSYRTLKFVTQIAEALRLTAPAPVSYDQFVYVPFPHNVYTIYRNFIGDFGLYGMLCAMVIIGFLHALLYLKARAGSEFCIYLYSLSLYSVIMVTFDDQYSMLGFYVDTALFGAIYMLLRSLPVFSLPRILKKPQHSGEHNIGG
jgi:oligosaccharide repeat unit polymerase